MSLGQDIFGSFIQHSWQLGKDLRELRRLKQMPPSELGAWREREVLKLHEEAVRTSMSISSDKDLTRRGESRVDSVRSCEVLLRGRRGIETSQNLLAGMNVRGLDMSRFVPGHIAQAHVDTADGDRHTKLPSDLRPPPAWLGVD